MLGEGVRVWTWPLALILVNHHVTSLGPKLAGAWPPLGLLFTLRRQSQAYVCRELREGASQAQHETADKKGLRQVTGFPVCRPAWA